MARQIIQSLESGKFLAPHPEDGQPTWVRALADAGGGICTDDPERIHQLITDWTDFDDLPTVVDLDFLLA